MLFEYLDNELSEADRKTVDEHIKNCEKCRKELEIRRELLRLVSDSAYYPKSELAAAFSGSQAVKKPKRIKLWKYGTVAAAAVLMVTVVLSHGFIERFIGGTKDAAMETAFDASMQSAETCAETMAAAASEEYTGTTSDAADDGSTMGTLGAPLMYSANIYDDGSEVPEAEEDETSEEEAGEASTNSVGKLQSVPKKGLAADNISDTDENSLRASDDEIMAAYLKAYASDYAETTAALYVIRPVEMFEITDAATVKAVEYEDCHTLIYKDTAAWNSVSSEFIEQREYYEYINHELDGNGNVVVVVEKPLDIK